VTSLRTLKEGEKNVLILLERKNEHSSKRNEIYLHSGATTNRILFLVERKEKFNLKFKLFIYSFFPILAEHTHGMKKSLCKHKTKNHLKCYKETLDSNASFFCCCDISNAIYCICGKTT
jgi:hypothetical protein